MKASTDVDYLVDGRWQGNNGIARYSREILQRLSQITTLTGGPYPTNPLDGLWTSWQIARTNPKSYYSPGYNAPVFSQARYAFTMHDLSHLEFAESWRAAKRLFYETILKPAARRASRIVTVSRFSKSALAEWASLPEEKIVVISNGCSEHFSPEGPVYSPGFPYLFFVGNQKPHKNIPRMLEAFAKSRASREVNFLISGEPADLTVTHILNLGLSAKVHFTGAISDKDLPSYYRGAVALVYPSLYEGFGLPLLESMACGTPALTSNTTALPEVAAGAALLVDPTNVSDIAHGIDQIVDKTELRREMRKLGFARASNYRWSDSAAKIQGLLVELAHGS